MSDNIRNLSPEELDKLGGTAGKLILARALADVIYAARVNLPSEQVGEKMEKFCEALDGYIDWRISGAVQDMLKELLAGVQQASGGTSGTPR